MKEVIERVEQAERLQDISQFKKLKGGENYYRIRVGEYRIGLTVTDDVVAFVWCLNRKEIYRYFP